MGKLETAKGYIEKYGGKPGLVLAVRELNLDVPVLNGIVVDYGTSIEKIIKLTKKEKLQFPLICRQSHPRDVDGQVDVWWTSSSPINNHNELEEAIKEGDKHFESIAKPSSIENKLLKGLGDYPIKLNEPPFYFIQKCGDGNRGSLIRHPTNKDIILVNYDKMRFAGNIAIWDKNQFTIEDFESGSNLKEGILKAISNYEKLEDSGLLDSKWSYQEELIVPLFSSNSVALQIRKFRPFVEGKEISSKRDGKLIYSSGTEYMKYGDTFYFGIPPPKGIKLVYINASLRNDSDVQKIIEWSKRTQNLLVYSNEILSGNYKYHTIGENLKSIKMILREGTPAILDHDCYRLFKFIPFGLIVPEGIKELSKIPDGTELIYYANKKNIELRKV